MTATRRARIGRQVHVRVVNHLRHVVLDLLIGVFRVRGPVFDREDADLPLEQRHDARRGLVGTVEHDRRLHGGAIVRRHGGERLGAHALPAQDRRRRDRARRSRARSGRRWCAGAAWSITAGRLPSPRATRAGPLDHVVQRRARRHHRVDRVFLLDAEIHHHRAGRRRARAAAHRPCRRARVTRIARQAVRVGELDVIGRRHRRGGVAAIVEELLPLPHHAEVAVVDDGDVDLDVLLHHRLQLGLRHLEAAVADDGPHFAIGTRQLGADRRGHAEAHRAEAARGDERAGLGDLVVLRGPHLVLADVGDDDGAAGGRLPDVVDHVRGAEPAVVGQLLDVAHGRSAGELADARDPGIVRGAACTERQPRPAAPS